MASPATPGPPPRRPPTRSARGAAALRLAAALLLRRLAGAEADGGQALRAALAEDLGASPWSEQGPDGHCVEEEGCEGAALQASSLLQQRADRASAALAALAAGRSGAPRARRGDTGSAGQGGDVHYWPHARGQVGEYMLTNYTIPANLSAALAWSWVFPEGRYHTVVRGNPLIDHQGNVVISTEAAVFKLNPEGEQLWAYYPSCQRREGAMATMSSAPSIMDGFVYGQCTDTSIWKVDLETGREIFSVRQALDNGLDTHYVEAYEGVVLQGVDSGLPVGGNLRILGVSAENATKLWEFRPHNMVWNFNPLMVKGTREEGSSVIFMDVVGGVYRVGLHDGKQIWHTPPPDECRLSFTDGGVMVGPDGTAYACSNLGFGRPGSAGVLRAYRFEDGHKLWDTPTPTPCTSWPAIAHGGEWGVVPIGNFVSLPLLLKLPGHMPLSQKLKIHNLSLALGPSMRSILPGIPATHTEVVAFDTKTGQLTWSFRTPDWQRMAAMGDEEGLLERMASNTSFTCLPTSWGTPTISGDGTVYVGHVSGTLYAFRDVNGNGAIDNNTEVATFDMGGAPLPNNAAWAPDMMAIATCDSLFVFKR